MTQKKLHFLVVSPTPLFPVVGGNRAHILGMVRQIRAAGHRVSFLYSIQENITNQSTLDTLKEVDAYYLSHYRQGLFHLEAMERANKRSVSEGVLINYQLDDWYDDEDDKMIKHIYENDPFDVILSNYIWMSRVFTAVPPHVLKIQQTHDCFSNRMVRLAKQGLPLTFFSVAPEDEARGLERADINIALQYNEEVYFRSLTSKPVLTLQYRPEKKPFIPSQIPLGRRLRVGFVGSDNNLNIKTLASFVTAMNAMPELAMHIELCVVGKIAEIYNSPPPAFVTLLGVREDLVATYNDMDVMINPMEDGTGLKIKSVEALQHHRPILMTKTGSDGLLSPYHFHNCGSLREILGYLKMIFQNPQLLPLMQAAGEKVLHAYENRLANAGTLFIDPHAVLAAYAVQVKQAQQKTEISETEKQEITALTRLVPKQAVWLDCSGDATLAIAVAMAGQAQKIFMMEFDPVYIEQIKIKAIAAKLYDRIDLSLLGFVAGAAQGYGILQQGKQRSKAVFNDSSDVVADAVLPFVQIERYLDAALTINVVRLGGENFIETLGGLEGLINKYHPVLSVTISPESEAAVTGWCSVKNYVLKEKIEGTTNVVLIFAHESLA